jgi:hypothetical protein
MQDEYSYITMYENGKLSEFVFKQNKRIELVDRMCEERNIE